MEAFPVVMNLADFITTPIVVGATKALVKTEWAGELDTLAGSIDNFGTGAATKTGIQIRNVTQTLDMLSVTGKFEVDNATGQLEGFTVNRAVAKWNKGDVLRVDISEVPSGADSAFFDIKLHAIALPDQV